MATAFVLMPFDQEFDPIFEGFIKPILEEAGLVVSRADNIESQQNILKDVMGGIGHADLIVADLTYSNPNVYYELGVAHASKKPTIHLTQSLEDVPFDLQSYRLVEYDTHFWKIGEAKKKLGDYAKLFLEGKLLTGNPVSDFYPVDDEQVVPIATANTGNLPKDAEVTDLAPEGEPGFLDYVVETIESYQQLQHITNSVSGETVVLTAELDKATKDFKRINANRSDSSAKAAQSVARRLANRMMSFTTALASSNKEFSDILGRTEDNLEHVVAFGVENGGATDPDLLKLVEQLKELLNSGRNAHDGLANWIDSMNDVPRIERRLNKATTEGITELLTMQRNIGRLLASVTRALNIVERDGTGTTS